MSDSDDSYGFPAEQRTSFELFNESVEEDDIARPSGSKKHTYTFQEKLEILTFAGTTSDHAASRRYQCFARRIQETTS